MMYSHYRQHHGDQKPNDRIESGDDQPMGCEEDGDGKTKAKTASCKQNEKLYEAEGILNTKLKKAEKKRRKKANKSTSVDSMDDDYDFKVDYTKRGSAMDVGDGSEENDDDDDNDNDNEISAEVPMSGIEFD
ncbi:hypothetical protein L1049_003745 [Liquidambar formosana]|uniref:Uncharacterized protein n=1 Tax=Liquidambar formosana TaxID=63359 RepID=A0AAP0WZP1_LIQFO